MSGWRTHPLSPWAGLFLGAAAWALHHQVGSDANVWSCVQADGGFVIMTGAVCLGLVVIGGLISWQARAPDPASQYHRFARAVGLLAAGIFVLAILFQTLAGAIVPACLR
jgi:hypothetical protein